jgi:uncharacterized CHY-type Zn-finger protein
MSFAKAKDEAKDEAAIVCGHCLCLLYSSSYMPEAVSAYNSDKISPTP